MENRKQRIGIVVSDKMNKTRVVVYEFLKKHPLYHKYVKGKKKFYVELIGEFAKAL